MNAVTEPVSVGADVFGAFVGAGFDPPLAIILAESTHTLDVTDGHTFTIHTEFPVGAEAAVTYHLFANTPRSPGDPPVITGSIDGDTLRFTMDYAIDRATLPADLLAQIDGTLPAAPPSGLLPGLRPQGGGAFARDGGSEGAIGAAVEGEISQVREFAIDQALEAAVEKTGSGKVKVAAGGWDAYKASKKVWESWEISKLMDDAMKTLDRLRKCVENPTNDATKQGDESRPEDKERAIGEIEDARDEIRANVAAMFLNLMVDTGSGLVKQAPWLGFIVSPAAGWVKETLTSLIDSRIADAKKSVTPCHRYAVATANGKLSVTGTIENLQAPFSLVGTFPGGQITLNYSGGPEGGTVTYTGGGGGATATGEGSYSLTAPDDDGVIFLTQSTYGCVDVGTCRDNREVLLLKPIE